MGGNQDTSAPFPVYTFMTFEKHKKVLKFFPLNTHWFAQKRYFKIQLANLVNLMRNGDGWCGTHDIFGCLEGLQVVGNPGWPHTHFSLQLLQSPLLPLPSTSLPVLLRIKARTLCMRVNVLPELFPILYSFC